MEGPVAGDGSKKSAQDASSSSKELKKPPRRRLLRRLSSNVGSEASAPTETKACAADDSQVRSIVSLPEVLMTFGTRMLARRSVNSVSRAAVSVLSFVSYYSSPHIHDIESIRSKNISRECLSKSEIMK